jgi:hypothetical protein
MSALAPPSAIESPEPVQSGRPANSEANARVGADGGIAPPTPSPRHAVRLDEASGRFVQELLDPASNEILRAFPDESQLAFSRGVRAYLDAISRG